MRPTENPSFLTPDDRLSEVAGILAIGMLRLHTRSALPENGPEPGQIPEITADFGPSYLDVSGKTVLSVHNG